MSPRSQSHSHPSAANVAEGGSLVRPFRGLLPDPGVAQSVAAPPYDVVSTEQARDLAAGNELSFLHVSKPEIDFPPGTSPYAPDVYAKAGDNLRHMIASGILRRDDTPHYYVYRIAAGDHVQTGLVVGGSIAAYRANRIRRHEVTRPEKEDDRVRQIDAANAQTGPVFAVHRADPEIARRLAGIAEDKPSLDVVAPDGSRHSVWPVADPAVLAELTAAFDRMDAIYIADGHHRSAAAARVAGQRVEVAPSAGPDAVYNSMLMVCFPEDQTRILGYHRLVRDLGGRSSEEFLSVLRASFSVAPADAAVMPEQAGLVGMYLAGIWYRLDLRRALEAVDDPVGRLDVSLLSSCILSPVLGIGDPRVDPRVDFLGGRDAAPDLMRRVDHGDMTVAFTVFPMRMADLFSVADADLIMPPKSTWFDPKLLDGLVSYPLD